MTPPNCGEPFRFADKVEVGADGCWRWLAGLNNDGYARFTLDGNGGRGKVLAHRWSYEHFVGPIPQGKQIDHICRVRHCVNPNHLEVVTGFENTHRSPLTNAGKTHCKHGHLLSGDNLARDHLGYRKCRACARRRSYAQYLRGRDRVS